MRAYRGTIVDISGAASFETAGEQLRFIRDGLLVIADDGTVAAVAAYNAREHRDLGIIDVRPGYIIPGFVDTHLHYPQTFSTNSWAGGNLLHWLDTCIYPAEKRLSGEECARYTASRFVLRRLAAGTTSALVVGSQFPHAQDALYEAHSQAHLRLISGRCIQTEGPDSARGLIFSEQKSIDLIVQEIERWHGRGLNNVALIPRFALSVSGQTLGALAEVFEHYRSRGVYFHTHLSESKNDEIPAVLATWQTRNYLDIFDNNIPHTPYAGSFLGNRSIFAHGVYLSSAELDRLKATSSSIAHCPTSQQFLGSGTFPLAAAVAKGVKIALGSDIGAGDQWLLAQVANTAFKVHADVNNATAMFLSPAQLLYLATLAGAQALDHGAVYGNFDRGKAADFLIIDPARCAKLADNLAYSISLQDDDDPTRELFTLMMGLEEQAIVQVFVQGRACACADAVFDSGKPLES